jgi:hypothetical protein
MTTARATFTESFVVPASDSATICPPVEPDEVCLIAGGTGWMGTFAKLARALIQDVLDDGVPVYTRFVIRHDDHSYRIVRGDVLQWADGNRIHFSDGLMLTLDTEELWSVSI